MRTAIDASVLWCLLNQEPAAGGWRTALERASQQGELVICPAAFAEISPAYASPDDVLQDLERLAIGYDPFMPAAAWRAGQVFKTYRMQGGPRTSLIPDFLIAAHALEQADRLAAADRGYLRKYFPGLKILGPDRDR